LSRGPAELLERLTQRRRVFLLRRCIGRTGGERRAAGLHLDEHHQVVEHEEPVDALEFLPPLPVYDLGVHCDVRQGAELAPEVVLQQLT
jgi:hypothetical protein